MPTAVAMTITAREVRVAAAELAKMRQSLAAWLTYRSLNDRAAAGALVLRRPMGKPPVMVQRDLRVEQDLASKLHALMDAVMQGASLPDPDLTRNPQGAVQLAQLALTSGSAVSSPTATGGLGAHPWLWPALIVGGVLLTVTTAIKTAADVAKDQEEKACIMAGACTDYGFWLKAGGVVAIAWFAWRELGLGAHLRKGRTS